MKMKNKMVVGAFNAVVLALSLQTASAIDFDINATGNYNTAGTWIDNSTGLTSLVVPGSSDTITIDSITADRGITLNVDPTISGLSFDSTFNVAFTPSTNRVFTINGNLSKANSGNMIFNSTTNNLLTMSITGDLSVTGGLLSVGLASNSNAVTSVTVGGTTTVSNLATLATRATTQTYGAVAVNGTFTTVGNSDATFTFAGLSGAATGSITSSAVSGARIRTANLNPTSGTSTYLGSITEGAFTLLKFNKGGAGTQILSGTNSYTGKTTITAGTLLINGTHTDAVAVTTGTTDNGYNSASAGHFQVANGGTLGGTGRIAGNSNVANSNMVYVASGGVLAPGSEGIGALRLDGVNISGTAKVLRMASGADFSFELAGNGGTPDRIDFWNYASGDIVLNNNEINLTLSGTQVDGTYTVSIFRFFSDNGATGIDGAIGSGLTFGTVDSSISSYSLDYNGSLDNGYTIDLTYTVAAVPEPSTYALVLGGLASLVFLRRKRRAS